MITDYAAMKLRYQRPPIDELVIGIYFAQPVAELRAEHIGLFWSQVRGDYPSIEQRPPIGGAIDVPAANEMFPLPRYWLTSADHALLLQLQRNAFLLNWRMRDTAYDSYEAVKGEFDRRFAQLSEFLKTEFNIPPPRVESAEIAYINTVRESDDWPAVTETPRIIPSYAPLSIGIDASALVGIQHVNTYQVDDALALTVNVRSAVAGTDKRLVFEIRGTGRFNAVEKKDVDLWFRRAHEVAGSAFAALTSEDARKRVWQVA